MTTSRDDAFRLRLGPPKARRSGIAGPAVVSTGFITQVLREVNRSGSTIRRSGRSAPVKLSRIGRGHVVARMLAARASPNARRVMVKSRLVLLKKASQAVPAHLRYIERDGVNRDGSPGQAYGPASDEVSLSDFEARGRDDRHQFRFMVSPEDASELENLKDFTRHLMGRMEADLGTRLDWIGVDHWDTAHPHAHIVLRGKDDRGKDLIIAKEYITHGMRLRAGEIATNWLGPRTERERQQARHREVSQERFTSLDRELLGQAQAQAQVQAQSERTSGQIELAGAHLTPEHRTLLIGRLQVLARMDLAERREANGWRLHNDLEPTLRALGERGDIIRQMQRALGRTKLQRELSVGSAGQSDQTIPITGRIIGKGLADELNDRGYLVIDGLDGRAHHVRLRVGEDLGRYPVGGIVQTRDTRTLLQSHLPIERQVSAMGATWLDKALIAGTGQIGTGGFGAEVREALQRRVDFLAREGLAERRGQRILLARDLLGTLRSREIDCAAREITAQTGLVHRPAPTEGKVSGTYRQSIQLVSGRFAMLDDGLGFSLVPWRPAIEQKLGQALTATIGKGGVAWELGRQRGLGI